MPGYTRGLLLRTFWTNFCRVYPMLASYGKTNKTEVMTTEAQPPSFLSTPAGLKIEIFDHVINGLAAC